MSDSVAGRLGASDSSPHRQQGSSANLADILERVLDKGVVIAGDIQINLLDIELLTIKLRLLVASVDKAKEMGIDWWEHDPSLSSRADRSPVSPGSPVQTAAPAEVAGHSGPDALAEENARLRAEIEALQGAKAPPEGQETPADAERPHSLSDSGTSGGSGGSGGAKSVGPGKRSSGTGQDRAAPEEGADS